MAMPRLTGLRSCLPWLVSATCVLVPAAAAAAVQAPPEYSKCVTCHGQNGDSADRTIPRLNGQQELYLADRLRSFRNPTRQTPNAIHFMWSVSSSLSNRVAQEMAKYLADQAPAPAPPISSALAEQGRKIFDLQGQSGTLACQSCHGPQGEGRLGVPRLAGQHGQYLRRQMEGFSIMARLSGAMNPHTRMLEPDQIKALVAYLAKD